MNTMTEEIIYKLHRYPSGELEEFEQVQELVRCKECKHWRNTDAEKIPTASIACGNMHADDFCSYGEREGE